MGQSTSSLVLLGMIASTAQIALAGNQYCNRNGLVNQFRLSRELKFIEDHIIPQTDGAPMPSDGLNCRWKIFNDDLDDPIVVLSDFNLKKHLKRRRRIRSSGSEDQLIHYALHLEPSNSSERSVVKEGMLRVLKLPRRSYLTASFRLTQASSVSKNTPGLRIRLMEPGFCGTDIANFKGSCYMSSLAQRSLADEMAAISEDSRLMSLASFGSYGALQDFVRESQRTRVGSGLRSRAKEALNLSESLRIGIFYEQSSQKVFYLNSSDDKCGLAEFHDAKKLNFTVPKTNSAVSCASMKATRTSDSGEILVVINFVDCNDRLPALISFPDEARGKCANCASTVLSWIQAAGEETTPRDNQQYYSPVAINANRILTFLTCTSIAALVVLAIVARMIKVKSPNRLLERRCHFVGPNLLSPVDSTAVPMENSSDSD